MKRLFTLVFMMLALSVGAASCSTDDPAMEMEQPVAPDVPDNDNKEEGGNEGDGNDENLMGNQLKMTVGAAVFSVTLESNAAATALKAMLPLTVSMAEMNGNEKYYYLPEGLPTASSSPGTIRAGDLMLYGSSCLVLFYETFRTSYSYTRIGRVDDPSGLSAALGAGDVRVTFEMK